MKIGCVKEIKDQEYRVGLTPSCVQAYVPVSYTHLFGIRFVHGDFVGSELDAYRYFAATVRTTGRTANRSAPGGFCLRGDRNPAGARGCGVSLPEM